MGINIGVQRALATAVAATVAGWGAFALPAAADPGNGNGNGNSASQGHPAQGSGNDDKGPKDGKGPKDSKDDKGPKGNNGNGPKDGKGPKDDNGPKDPKDDKGPKHDGASGPKDGKGPKDGGNGDPAGNNGTVKITPHMEDDGIPQNTPHVSCIFDIEWYGFDEGDHIISTVVFEMQAPTSDVALSGTEPSTVFVGGDPASGAGTDSGFDGEATYRLGFDGEPHPKQGYHVKLTVHTPGSQGADTKHKVFWVQPCAAESAATEEEPVETPSETPSVAPSEAAVEESGDEETGVEDTAEDVAAGTLEQGAAEAGAVAGTQAGAAGTTSADVPNEVAAGEEGSLVSDVFTSPLGLLVIALGLAITGAAIVARRRAA